MENFWLALLLTTLAGGSTLLGSLLGFVIKKPTPMMMSWTLGFSAGVMILVSFVELLPGGISKVGFAGGHIALFAGIVFMFLIDALIPHSFGGESANNKPNGVPDLHRTGLFVALGLGVHNFPEGIATFVSALADPRLGLALAVAIAIHNIPEGLAVSAPVYAATGSRAKAFLWSALSGMAEPVGALIGAVFLLPFLSDMIMSLTLAFVAGIMVYIALDELLPAARAFGHEHLAISGTIAGMMVMALSLYLLL